MGEGEDASVEVRAWGQDRPRSIMFGLRTNTTLGTAGMAAVPLHFNSRNVVGRAQLRSITLPDPTSGLPWGELLTRLAHDNHLNLVSDSFEPIWGAGLPKRGISFPTPGAPPAEWLDQLCLAYDRTWNAEGPLLLFRQRDWYLRREQEIPQRLVRRWQKIAHEQGDFPLRELATMAGLRGDAQFFRLRRITGLAVVRTVRANQKLLLLYAALRPEQLVLACGEGLNIDRIDVAQQRLLSLVLAEIRPGPLDVSRSFVRLEARDIAGEPSASITLIFRDGLRETITLSRRIGLSER
jgi:hypothetical protein